MEKNEENGKKTWVTSFFSWFFFYSGALLKSNNQLAYLKTGDSASDKFKIEKKIVLPT